MLKGKTAVITGARRGIGRETVEVFAKCGANIFACARCQNDEFESDMKALEEKYNVTIQPLYFELTNAKQIVDAVKVISKSKVTVDILVNIAAAVADSTNFAMTSIDKIKGIFDSNFYGTTLLVQYISRIMMRKCCGSIVNISSVAALDGTPGQYEYVSSKAALLGATKYLARELGSYGIRVNAIAPGIVQTSMGDQIDIDLKNEVLDRTIMKRAANPEEIANVIAFLSSDYASYITGQTIRVDGGM